MFQTKNYFNHFFKLHFGAKGLKKKGNDLIQELVCNMNNLKSRPQCTMYNFGLHHI